MKKEEKPSGKTREEELIKEIKTLEKLKKRGSMTKKQETHLGAVIKALGKLKKEQEESLLLDKKKQELAPFIKKEEDTGGVFRVSLNGDIPEAEAGKMARFLFKYAREKGVGDNTFLRKVEYVYLDGLTISDLFVVEDFETGKIRRCENHEWTTFFYDNLLKKKEERNGES
jgi:hypothetical protein